MSMIEEEVLSYIVASGDLDAVTVHGKIGEDHFLDPRNRSVFREIISFKADYGEAPTAEVILRAHPQFPFVKDSSGPITYLVDELHETRRRTIIDLGLDAVDSALEKGGSEEALAVLRLTLAQASSTIVSSREIDYAATGEQRLERYRQARLNPGGMVGMPTGFRFLDRVTNGIQPGQMGVFTGLAKSCKTTVLLGVLRSVYDWGALPFLMSFEMPEAEISRRLDGFAAEVNPTKLQTGEISEVEWRRLERLGQVRTMEGEHRPFLISEDRAATMTLSGIQTKIDQYAPTVVFIDGAYFLHDEISRESQTALALTNISRGLKKMALNNNVPVLVTTQSLSHKVGAKGLTAHSLGYTSAWVQDADFVVGMEATDEDGCYRLKLLASRNATPQETLLYIDWNPPRFEEAPEDETVLPY